MHRIALVIFAGTETHEGLARLVNALMTAREAREHGDDVVMIFDGAGTEGLATLTNPEHQAHPLLKQVLDTVRGACYYCSGAFGVREQLKARGIPLLKDYKNHPSLRALLEEGRTVLTF